ncbi:MAG: hypothetical protein WDK96_00360 [Candidatus Paceibacterota bacterium]|jgi:hypothetical protein
MGKRKRKNIKEKDRFKGSIFNIFHHLKKERLIESFEKNGSNISSEVFSFKVILKKGLSQTISLYKTKIEENCNQVSEKSKEVKILIGDKLNINDLAHIIKKALTHRINGDEIEKDFFQFVLCKIVNKGKSLSDIEKTDDKTDCLQGIDYFLIFCGKKIPIQIKSATREQEKHTKTFPKIPSLVWKKFVPEETKEQVEKRKDSIFAICTGYIDGKIKHLQITF